jgi:hypothetical protein
LALLIDCIGSPRPVLTTIAKPVVGVSRGFSC